MYETLFELNDTTLQVIEAIGEAMPGGFFIYYAKEPERLVYANHQVFSMFGCDNVDDFTALTGYTFRGMVHPDDYDEIQSSINGQIAHRQDKNDYVEYRIIQKDGGRTNTRNSGIGAIVSFSIMPRTNILTIL